ncbi:hypothetical protein [Anaerotignum sp. MSJ-24]|uniref:hypothetical protein n=1 Tax=Anaerotignum sp. MSJ-24 TaxID=2841521 RepID=UPI001C107431|nr:hypothetical protein [Anaerotignum sp. MSJ-24]MBU5463928.1 hypothetical protein [Anaerotignum sp. MSJ-24]
MTMTNKEKYKRAFSALHASENISLEVDKDMKNKRVFNKKIMAVCTCCLAMFGVGATVYAHNYQIINKIFGWGNNLEITQEVDENGETSSISILHTDNLTEPVKIDDGKIYFVVNDEKIDITDKISETTAFEYEYTDDEGNTHIWLVGLNSDNIKDYGYAEYIKNIDGDWTGGYSARVNIESDGKTNAEWLENAKSEKTIPW